MLSGRVIYKKGKRSVYHASARASFNGGSVELGGRYKWSDLTSTGLALRVGNQVGFIHMHTHALCEQAVQSPGFRQEGI